MPAKTAAPRIEYLDGLRGFAILMVIVYHAYSRWPALYAFGDRFVGNPFFDTGRSGVRLFFMISGFVILMTLQKCPDFWTFLKHRWIRLFPAMLICSAIILLTSTFFPDRPAGPVHFLSLLPSLTFTGGTLDGNPFWAYLAGAFGLGSSPESVEGSFWSLYVEVKFYIVFGVAYFYLGERRAIALLIVLFLAGAISDRLYTRSLSGEIQSDAILSFCRSWMFNSIYQVTHLLQSFEYGWFAAGALLFKFTLNRNPLLLLAGIIISAISARLAFGPPVGNYLVALLFVSAVASTLVQRAFAGLPFVFLGFASYPLYLLHENMMVAMIVNISRVMPDIPDLLIPIFPICIVVFAGWLVAKYLEPRTMRALRAAL